MSTAQQNENNADSIIKHPCAICGSGFSGTEMKKSNTQVLVGLEWRPYFGSFISKDGRREVGPWQVEADEGLHESVVVGS